MDHQLPERSATQLSRRLNDGREFRIYKAFYDAPALEERLRELGWSFRVGVTERYFIFGHGRHGAARAPGVRLGTQ